MGVLLVCEECGTESVSSLFYKGPAGHHCHHCGGALTLADPTQDRRAGTDRRDRILTSDWSEWRTGTARRREDAQRA